jgi:hypothetical protein
MVYEIFEFDPRNGRALDDITPTPIGPKPGDENWATLGISSAYVVGYLEREDNLVYLHHTEMRNWLKPHTREQYISLRHPPRRGAPIDPVGLWMDYGIVLRLEEWLLANQPIPPYLNTVVKAGDYSRVAPTWSKFESVVKL